MPQPAPTPDRPFPLSEAATGAALRVAGLAATGARDGQAARLAELGFLPGEPARVLRRAFGGDPLQVRVGASTFALRRAEAAGVLVEGWAEDAP